MRPQQWIENLFIFAGLIFSLNLFNVDLLAKVLAGFILFSLWASVFYIFNDIQDIKKNRDHPEKCKRPLAAGNRKLRDRLGQQGRAAYDAEFGEGPFLQHYFAAVRQLLAAKRVLCTVEADA